MMTGPLFRDSVRWSAALALGTVVWAPVLACGFCANLNGNPLALSHPKAIEIAMATRAAIDKGQLREPDLVPQADLFDGGVGTIALRKVPTSLLVKAWARKCKAVQPQEATWVVRFLFIDTEETCDVSVRGGTIVFEVTPSAHCDGRVVTTRTAVAALLTGTLRAADACSDGLVILEGDARAARLLRQDSDAAQKRLADHASAQRR